MRRSRVALFLFLGTFATGLYTADIAPPPQGVAADYGRCGLAGPPPMGEDEVSRPDWCLPSPAIDALLARRDRRPAEAAAAYAPASRKVAGRVRRDARPAPPVEAPVEADAASIADLPTCMPQTPWSCPLALPLREAELERGLRTSLAPRRVERKPDHPGDLPRGEVLAEVRPRVLLGNLAALARDPRHSTGSALALRLNAETDGLSRRVAAAPPRDSYSRRYDYPFDYDCRMMRDEEATAAFGAECNADEAYAAGRGYARRAANSPATAIASEIVREDLRIAEASTAAAPARQLLALLAAGARLTRDAGAAADDWRVRMLAAVRSAAAAAPEQARRTEAVRPVPPPYLGL